jgi:hypothetical protein
MALESVGSAFSWNTHGAFMWRLELGAFCGMLGLTPDNYKACLQEWFGPNWVHSLRPVIESVKVPELHGAEESRASLAASWIVVNNERERRRRQRGRKFVGLIEAQSDATIAEPGRPAQAWAS